MGDHLIVERLGGAYAHHGVYIGNNEVIHLRSPYFISRSSPSRSFKGPSNQCSICNYVTPRWGGVVRTCLDCFHGGASFYVREYGIQVSGDTISSWILNKLNASRAIYTFRKGDIYLGKWTERNTVIHLVRTRPGTACHYTGRLETSLQSFLCGGLLYINELGLHVARYDGGDGWRSCQDKPIVSVFRRLMEQNVDRVHIKLNLGFDRGFDRVWNQWAPPPFIIYQNQQIQVCELTSTRSPAHAVHAAFSYLDNGFNRYNLLWNNCEHFAANCRTDEARSIQSENWKRAADDRKIQQFLDSCDPPHFSIPMETLMNTHLPT